MISNIYKPEPMLSWNPKAGYSCTGCDWMRRVHVGPELPKEDEIAKTVRREFAEHLREHHSSAARPLEPDFRLM